MIFLLAFVLSVLVGGLVTLIYKIGFQVGQMSERALWLDTKKSPLEIGAKWPGLDNLRRQAGDR